MAAGDGIADGDYLVVRGEETVEHFKMQDIAPKDRALVSRLMRLLEEQSGMARLAVPMAGFELGTNRKRIDNATEGGKKTTKSTRGAVEQQVRACLRRGDDPTAYAADWAEEYDYSVRHIRNIIKRVRAE